MAKIKGNAFRVIPKELFEAYKTGNIDAIPNLEGFNFNQGENVVNTYTYDPNKKYLHFFGDFHEADTYKKNISKVNRKQEYCICAFHFDEQFLAENKFAGCYYSEVEYDDVMIEEYIFPVEHYNAKENFVGIADPETYEKKGKVYYDPDNYGWFF